MSWRNEGDQVETGWESTKVDSEEDLGKHCFYVDVAFGGLQAIIW